MSRHAIRQNLQERIESIESVVREIRFPDDQEAALQQDREWCEVVTDEGTQKIRFHDYDQIYQVPGLYEELFYDRLECQSPYRVVELLDDVVEEFNEMIDDLKVIEIGAGNGIVGETLNAFGAEKVVGIDIIEEAREAAVRDRPEVYDDYHVVDLTDISEHEEKELRKDEFNCLVTVAAMGFGDLPPTAFAKALDLIEIDGWLAFNLKEDFVQASDRSGFATLIHELQKKKIIQVQAYRRYRHRLSLAGESLYYTAFIARKLQDVPDELLGGA